MSVHGEYNRALDAFLSTLRKLDHDLCGNWVIQLEGVRANSDLDLTTAARSCLTVLDVIDADRNLSAADRIGPDHDALREPFQHLRSHCHAVLGMEISSGRPR